jgi:hypothetical protein
MLNQHMIRKHIYLTEKQNELLNKEIESSGLKLAELVRRIFDEHFQTKENKCQNQPSQ